MNFDTRAKAQVEMYQALWKKEEEKPEIWLGLLDQHGDAQTDFGYPIKTGDLKTFGCVVATDPEQIEQLKAPKEFQPLDDYSPNEVVAGRFTNNLALFDKLAKEKAEEQRLLEDYYNE